MKQETLKKEKYKKKETQKKAEKKNRKPTKWKKNGKSSKIEQKKGVNVLKPAELDMLTTLAPGLTIKHYNIYPLIY